MSRFLLLAIVALFQVAFIVLTLILLFVTRMRGSVGRARDTDASIAIAPGLRSIMLGDDRGEMLADALSKLRPHDAAAEMMAIGGSRLSGEQLRNLAKLVRRSAWVEHTLRQGSSRKWWKRMEAARLIAVVCDEGDDEILAPLVTDPHPAVASAATTAIGACAGARLIEAVVTGLPSRFPSVRLRQCNALRNHSELATRIVVDLFSRPASAQQLRAWVQLVEILATPQALAAVVPLASHPDVEVRTSTARALRSYFSPDATEAVARLLGDEDWRVRAAAARAVGALKVVNAIPLLTDAMRDESWWVRFRAALALAELSQEGRSALDAARNSPDPYARDMATMVCGLSAGSCLELTSA